MSKPSEPMLAKDLTRSRVKASRRRCSSSAIFIDVFAQWHAREGVRAVFGSARLFIEPLSRSA
jgi:hypothetical protein